MESDSTLQRQAKSTGLFSFGIANLLMLIALAAVSVGWWVDRNQTTPQPVQTQSYDISGPLFVSYKVRTSPSSTAGGNISNVQGINYRGDMVVVVTDSGGMVFNISNLIEFVWSLE